jgi:alpha-beta hydrolase superfamily lysophospholipase
MRPWVRRAVIATVGTVVAANALAFVQARAMTHFAQSGARTHLPEELSTPEKVAMLFTGINVPHPVNTHTPRDLGLEYETRSIPGSAGQRLEAWIIRPPQALGWVLLLHGYTASKQQVLVAAQRFVALGYGAVLVDFPGSGGTPGERTTLGYFEARDAAAAGHWVEQELGGPLVVYGFSMGAAAALRAVAEEGLAPAALVVEAPFDRMLTTVEHRFQMMGFPAFPLAEMLVFWGGLQNGFNGFAHNPVDYASRVTCPTLILAGERDLRVRPEEARAIAERLGGPKKLAVVPGAGHEVTPTLSEGEWRGLVETMLPVHAR